LENRRDFSGLLCFYPNFSQLYPVFQAFSGFSALIICREFGDDDLLANQSRLAREAAKSSALVT